MGGPADRVSRDEAFVVGSVRNVRLGVARVTGQYASRDEGSGRMVVSLRGTVAFTN